MARAVSVPRAWAMSRAEARHAVEGAVQREVLERVAEELRHHGIEADVARDPMGVYDVYIGLDDVDKLDRRCREGEPQP